MDAEGNEVEYEDSEEGENGYEEGEEEAKAHNAELERMQDCFEQYGAAAYPYSQP